MDKSDATASTSSWERGADEAEEGKSPDATSSASVCEKGADEAAGQKFSDATSSASVWEENSDEAEAGAEDAAWKLSEEKGASLYHDAKADKTTGATPGVATACRDLGVSSLAEALSKYKCNPPGQ